MITSHIFSLLTKWQANLPWALALGRVLLFGGWYKVNFQFYHLVCRCRRYASDTTAAPLRPVCLLQEASRLDGDMFRCRGWYHAVDLDFNQSSTFWSVIGFHPIQILISPAGIFAEHVSIAGQYYNHIAICYGYIVPAYTHIWVPSFTFDTILALLAVWAGIKHSRQQSYAHSRFNKPRLVDILIHGNVVYFIRWAFSCHY